MEKILTEKGGARMEKILTDFIKIVRQFLAGRHTDCGGEIDDSNDGQCCGCRHYGECRKNYQFTDAIEELLKRAAEQHNKASVADLRAPDKSLVPFPNDCKECFLVKICGSDYQSISCKDNFDMLSTYLRAKHSVQAANSRR